MALPFEAKFGYLPERLDVTAGDLSITTLPNLDETVSFVNRHENIRKDWLYAGNARTVNFLGIGESIEPYSGRVFKLPKTHVISHLLSESLPHLKFHVWVLSFFNGMRLTTEAAGFLDSTPTKKGKLVDFIVLGDAASIIDLAETFWQKNPQNPIQAKRFSAAVHALFLSQNPQNMQFEQFIYLYTALDACFAILWEGESGKRPDHFKRVKWMCKKTDVVVPDWALIKDKSTEVSELRNLTIHEGLFVDEPLGFAIEGLGDTRNLTLEMEALICRILASIIGVTDTNYIGSPVDTMQMHGLRI